jgi:DNA invertase Pin-like site-specific DNA recombinase
LHLIHTFFLSKRLLAHYRFLHHDVRRKKFSIDKKTARISLCTNRVHAKLMIYGYTRISSNRQELEQQLAQLDAAGCVKIFREKISATTADRPQLKRLIAVLDVDDELVVTSTDRIACNTRNLLNILHRVKEAGAGFRSIMEPIIDTTSQFAEVVFAVLDVAARYEHDGIIKRTAAGRVEAKARGVKFGRPPALTPDQQTEALQRLAAGDSQCTVARFFNVAQGTISRLSKSDRQFRSPLASTASVLPN